MIDIGGQIRISGDLTTPEIEAIVGQHRKYGMVEVGEIDRTKPFVGLCYSVDKPISVERIRNALVHNAEVLTEIGRARRQEAAIAVSNQLEAVTPGLQALEMSFVEEQGKSGASPQIAEGVRVTRRAQPGGPPAIPRRPGRRAG